MDAQQSLYTFNRGVVDRRGLARLDVKRLQMAAEQQTNWLPMDLGPMCLRPGRAYLGNMLGNAAARMLAFVFATDDTAALEMTSAKMRVWIDDVLLTRPAVTTAVTNGTFDADIVGWTDLDAGSAVSAWVAGGYMGLTGDGTSRAIREQAVTCLTPNVEHALRIVINRGPVMLRVGSTSGGEEYQSETTLETGTHSIAFTPTGDFYVRFFSALKRIVRIDSCVIESSGVVELPTPWSASDLNLLRPTQSADVVYVACKGKQQRKIERRGTRPGARSWSVALYRSIDGPFMVENTGSTTLNPTAATGNITIASSEPMFSSTHVGALFSLTSVGQTTTANISAQNTFTASVRVTGVGTARIIAFTISGTFVATVQVQRSFDNATWTNVGAPLSWTVPTAYSYNDTLDNQIVYYRIGVNTGDYTSGTVVCTERISQGSIRGVVRVTGYVSTTSVNAEVISDLGGTAATAVWQEGMWSDKNGWPMAVSIHEGRMWWSGLNGVWGSISDAYDAFDETFPGDAGPINRTIGSGPVDTINWLLSLKGLALGAQGAEYLVRSSSLDEPITPTNFNMKSPSSQGSGVTGAIKIDQAGYFVDRTGCQVFELAFNVREYDYTPTNLMELCPEVALARIVRIDVQRKPNTRIHAVLDDGTALVGVVNRQEEILAWIPIEAAGDIEDVLVLPAALGDLDDRVYYVVKYTVNGSTVRFYEKWAQAIDCRGASLSYLADAYVAFSGAAATSFYVPHLIGKAVVVWADGADIGTDESTWSQLYTVSASGYVTTPTAYADVVIGLGYEARFKSVKLGILVQGGSPLGKHKRIKHLGMILADTHKNGVQYGPDFNHLDDMPLIEEGAPVTQEVHEDFDSDPIEFPGTWDNDARLCLRGQAPRPATVIAATLDLVQT